jgi:hypothetical protein
MPIVKIHRDLILALANLDGLEMAKVVKMSMNVKINLVMIRLAVQTCKVLLPVHALMAILEMGHIALE